MNERLIVKNFLCLKDIDIEVKDFLILIGPQAAGKSLCAKLLYFFRTIAEEIAIYIVEAVTGKKQDLKTILLNKFEVFFPKEYWANEEFSMEYGTDSFDIFKLEKKHSQELTIDISNVYPDNSDNIIIEIVKQNFFNEFTTLKSPEEIKIMINNIVSNKRFKNDLISSSEIFIPAGRSFFSLLQKNIFTFLMTNNSIDPFIKTFGVFYESVKNAESIMPQEARDLVHAILKGDYIPENNSLLLENGKKINLEILSSGQQEALPLALILGFILPFEEKKNVNIYVEEPEAHLFPDAQDAMSRLISFVKHNSRQKTAFVITTHSPYMLAAFNNLIKAGNIVKQNPALKEAVRKEISESMHIDIERFAAYSLDDGRAVSIIDNETNLINADAIDSVSEIIMETFNTLQDIESENSKAGENV